MVNVDESIEGKKLFIMPFKETSWGLVKFYAKDLADAKRLVKEDEDFSLYDHMDHCGDLETEFSEDQIEEG